MNVPHEAREVLDFWFNEVGEAQWFEPGEGLDERIAARFSGLLGRLAREGVPEAWLASGHGRLAAVIVFDQFPRNIHRGTRQAFDTDPLALALAEETLAAGLDFHLSVEERKFLYMPFQHAEALDVQERSVDLFDALGDPNSSDYARQHRDLIRRFGRFPYRNAALGRRSTPEEEAWLAEEKTQS